MGEDAKVFIDFTRLIFNTAQNGSDFFEEIAKTVRKESLVDTLLKTSTTDNDAKTILANFNSFMAVAEVVYKGQRRHRAVKNIRRSR